MVIFPSTNPLHQPSAPAPPCCTTRSIHRADIAPGTRAGALAMLGSDFGGRRRTGRCGHPPACKPGRDKHEQLDRHRLGRRPLDAGDQVQRARHSKKGVKGPFFSNGPGLRVCD